MNNLLIRKGPPRNISASVDISLKYIKLTKIRLLGIFPAAKKRKEASNTPAPLGAAGIISPIDQDIQKVTHKETRSFLFTEYTVFKQKRNPTNFDNINAVSNKNAFSGKKEVNVIRSSNRYFKSLSLRALKALPFKDSSALKTK